MSQTISSFVVISLITVLFPFAIHLLVVELDVCPDLCHVGVVDTALSLNLCIAVIIVHIEFAFNLRIIKNQPI